MIDLPSLTEATWPPAARHPVGPWIVREGQGAGQRVSATSPSGDWTEDDIGSAEDAMRALGQTPIFVIWQGQEALDTALAARGYRINDPVTAYAVPTATLAEPAPPFLATFPHWPPLGIAKGIWQEAGLNPARFAVMERVTVPKTVILGRSGDRAAGVAFVAVQGKTAMLHALDVAPAFRRQRTAHNIMRAAGAWAQDQGAETLALLVTEANAPARALYASLGMTVVGHYHYRKL